MTPEPKGLPERVRRPKPEPFPNRGVCDECGEVVTIPSDHLPNCPNSVAIVGRFLPQGNALLDATGSTPIKLMLHADGTVTWRPLFGQDSQ